VRAFLCHSTLLVNLASAGNAGGPLHRLPVFNSLLSSWTANPALDSSKHPAPLIIAVAPRSYWKSTNTRPTERGITSDYAHVLNYTLRNYPGASVVLYGHSLGGAAAICLLAQLREPSPEMPTPPDSGGGIPVSKNDYSRIKGLIVENPFASIPGMVRALYPQRWLPYHHMADLAWDRWDAVSAIGNVSLSREGHAAVLARLKKDMMLLLSERDEVVPSSMGEAIWAAALHCGSGDSRPTTRETESNLDSAPAHRTCEKPLRRKVVVEGALHEDAWTSRKWIVEVRRYIDEVGKTE
jgi:uncharacterized protein